VLGLLALVVAASGERGLVFVGQALPPASFVLTV
jgi:hypothetical protein